MMTDPITDVLVRIRNAQQIEKPQLEMPATKLKVAIAKYLVNEGYILGYRCGIYSKTDSHPAFVEVSDLNQANVILQVFLKYHKANEPSKELSVSELRRKLDSILQVTVPQVRIQHPSEYSVTKDDASVELALQAYIRDGVDPQVARQKLLALYNSLNDLSIAKFGKALSIKDFQQYLLAEVPAEVLS